MERRLRRVLYGATEPLEVSRGKGGGLDRGCGFGHERLSDAVYRGPSVARENSNLLRVTVRSCRNAAVLYPAQVGRDGGPAAAERIVYK